MCRNFDLLAVPEIIDDLSGLRRLAVGNALGTTIQLKSPGTLEPIDDMAGDGPFNLQPGRWTDDTSTAPCLATSPIERGGLDVSDHM